MPSTAFGLGVLLGGGLGAAWLTITTRREVARQRRRVAHLRRMLAFYRASDTFVPVPATRRAQGAPGRS